MTIFFPFKNILPSIRYFGKSILAYNTKYENTHIAMEIAYIVRGKGYFFQSKNIPSAIKKGDVLIIKSGLSFYIQSASDAELEFYYLGIYLNAMKISNLSEEEKLLLPFYEKIYAFSREVFRQNIGGNVEIEKLYKKTYTELSKHDGKQIVLAKGYCLQTIVMIFNFLHENAIFSDDNFFSGNTQRIDGVIKYIEENYHKEIILDKLASKAFLSPYHFIRVFKKYSGLSPMQYVNNYRVEKARYLLADKNLSLSEIAGMIGLKDVYYFSSVFRKIQGVSPGQYRKAVKSSKINYPE
jgi:AraC-like DNA-binding protein